MSRSIAMAGVISERSALFVRGQAQTRSSSKAIEPQARGQPRVVSAIGSVQAVDCKLTPRQWQADARGLVTAGAAEEQSVIQCTDGCCHGACQVIGHPSLSLNGTDDPTTRVRSQVGWVSRGLITLPRTISARSRSLYHPPA